MPTVRLPKILRIGVCCTCIGLVAYPTPAPGSSVTRPGATTCELSAELSTAQLVLPDSSKGPDNAAITAIVFCDFESFPCSRLTSVLIAMAEEERQMRVIFKHAPSQTNPHALLAHEAALAAGAQGKFWEMHDLLFQNQTKLTRADLIGYAEQLRLDLTAFKQALDSHIYRPIIERDLAEAKGLGVTTTPTLFINGRRLVGLQSYGSLEAVVDSLLVSIPKTDPSQQEILSSGPAVAINLNHASTKGPARAPVNIVEFSDFECPFCAESTAVVREMLRAYPTQVRFSFKHYPLPFHREAELAHEAALAAGAQGKFWEMHDLLFATQGKLAREDLIEKARQLKLDMPRLISDLDNHHFKSQVDADRREGDRLGVDGTPFFFVNGHAFSGAPTFAQFKRVIDEELKNVAAQQASNNSR